MKFKCSRALLGIGLAGSLMAFDTPTNEFPKNDKLIILLLNRMIQSMHYDPQKINDDFSKKLFWSYIGKMDVEKKYFLQQDIEYLKKYELQLDDEINKEQQLSFLKAADSLMDIRIGQVSKFYGKAFEKPFIFTEKEVIQLDYSKVSYAKDIAELEKYWAKSAKYSTLMKLTDMMDLQKKTNEAAKSTAEMESEARAKVKKRYEKLFNSFENIPSKPTRFEMYANNIATIMDPHSSYMSPVSQRSLTERVSGTYCGIGLVLSEHDDYVKIEDIRTGGPAWKQGELKTSDLILKVGETGKELVDVSGYSINELVKLTRGAKGTSVTLMVKRFDNTIKLINVIRDELKQDNVFARSFVFNGKHKIGMIVLPEFYLNPQNPLGPGSSSYDMAREVQKLKEENVEGIIIDLRGNGGGSMRDVVNIAGLFIPEGPVVQVRTGDGKVQSMDDKNPEVAYDGPLAIMVNERSASASEILSACMQDYKRAVIVGSPNTFGKGTVQRVFDLKGALTANMNQQDEDLGGAKLTIQKFYRVNGSSTQLKGVTPDIILKDQYFSTAEKNEPFVMNWDEIAPTNYTAWRTPVNVELLQQKSKKRVAASQAFKLIDENIEQYKKRSLDKTVPLNMKAFMAAEKANSIQADKQNKLKELDPKLDMVNMKNDIAAMEGNTYWSDTNKSILKAYKSDHYIAETLNVIYDMINENAQTHK
ncbi:carboxy terminal-processing peptidase [Solitalea sp. MAHUQ-68]|uniref:Carboxy terminal-processing peptidase n=1 Tax=Solitalea agri TaxID=2953739 RepID=A0A9X2F4C7_9SPHI|nr:carboxy terminal-processing peptidase [Solitalea agri]MCO4294569.1 carboxy terminal-processing peptidase [Solitalea agri]